MHCCFRFGVPHFFCHFDVGGVFTIRHVVVVVLLLLLFLLRVRCGIVVSPYFFPCPGIHALRYVLLRILA